MPSTWRFPAAKNLWRSALAIVKAEAKIIHPVCDPSQPALASILIRQLGGRGCSRCGAARLAKSFLPAIPDNYASFDKLAADSLRFKRANTTLRVIRRAFPALLQLTSGSFQDTRICQFFDCFQGFSPVYCGSLGGSTLYIDQPAIAPLRDLATISSIH